MSKIRIKQVTIDQNVDVNSNKLTNVTDPTAAQDAATKAYVDSQIHSDPTDLNKEMTASVTAVDGAQATATTVAATPAGDSYVKVEVNGVGAVVGDAVKTKDCYFSGDGGTTARDINDIASGDTLHWNGTVAGFELDASDIIDLFYNT